ncbi:MAG: hypothetical protein ACC634_08665 [Hyphomicrobiales bacterium]
MSPLVVTVILIFAAGVVGFFFGCLFARWLHDGPLLVGGAKLPFKMDLALITATPTGSDPSTSVMLYKPKGAAPESATVAPPSSAVAAAAALAEKTAEPVQSGDQTPEPMPLTQAPIAALAPPTVSAEKKAQSKLAVGTSSTAAGSANPSVTPLRGPLAVARATSKGGGDKKKAAKMPSRRKSDKKPQVRKTPKSDISIAASKSKATSKAKSAGTAKKPAKSAVKKPVVTVPGETQAKKPRFMPKPRKAGPDDLKRIKGVGPALEATLNTLGVFHYNQISKWTPENVMWVDDHLKFKGRIARDNWLDQAAILEAGEVTEFAGRVDKGAVASSKGKPRRTKS